MSKLIVALDFPQSHQALSLVDQLEPKLCSLKIGSELFTREGPEIVRTLIKRGYRVFLDLKFHDIPHTVAKACLAAADMGVWMLTLHASGGAAMLHAAQEAIVSFGNERPKLIAVTVLTSFSEMTLQEVGVAHPLTQQVNHLAIFAQQQGMDGVVSSAQEVANLKKLCGSDFLVVTPGIRLPGEDAHDQSRVITPQAAIQMGSDYLVMGRSITQAKNPLAIIQSLQSILK